MLNIVCFGIPEIFSYLTTDSLDIFIKAKVCVCVCLVLHSSRLLGLPFAEVGIRKSRPPGSPEGPRCYLLVR